jgi:hypothetical protein
MVLGHTHTRARAHARTHTHTHTHTQNSNHHRRRRQPPYSLLSCMCLPDDCFRLCCGLSIFFKQGSSPRLSVDPALPLPTHRSWCSRQSDIATAECRLSSATANTPVAWQAVCCPFYQQVAGDMNSELARKLACWVLECMTNDCCFFKDTSTTINPLETWVYALHWLLVSSKQSLAS